MIIVSVGADDVEWSIMTRLCAASAVCNDKVSTAYFNQLLNSFTRSYYQLLGDLAALPHSPAVLVNEYYSPFGPNIGCLAHYGLTAAKEKVLLARLGQLNTVLARGRADLRVRGGRPAVHRPRAVHRRPLRPGPERPGTAAPDRDRRSDHRPGRPAGTAQAPGGLAPAAVSRNPRPGNASGKLSVRAGMISLP